MASLNLFQTPLQDLSLIEASAGTGKTYTITGLYLRLVVELGLKVEQILVVTYTRAATAELRGRIRQRLQQARQALEQGHSDDPMLQQLIRHSADTAQAGRRLQTAVLDFDRAVIFTIHGFCQRVLADHAFESAMPFESELLTDQQGLLQEVVDDFWRQRIQDLSPGLIGYLLHGGTSPEVLLQQVRPGIGRPYLECRGRPWPGGLQAMEQQLQRCFDGCRALWREQAGDIRRLLEDSRDLNRNKYRPASVANWLDALDHYLQAERPAGRFEGWEKFAASTLAGSVKRGGTPPSHPFFGRWQELVAADQQLQEAYHSARVALLGELLEQLNRELPRRKAQQRVQAYDDLLLNLQQSLQGEQGEALAWAVRERYQAALIDEFQDTDPVQYGIFHRIYGDTRQPVFLVGDPKQAIYSFRGADVFAYLKARQDAVHRHTLDLNWRSAPALLQAVNALYDQPHPTFYDPRIAYQPARPAVTGRLALVEEGGTDAAFRIGFLGAGDKPLNKQQATALSVEYAAGEIARLLLLGRDGALRLGERCLAGGDIAVLVRSHRQGAAIASALLERGIHSVQRSRDDVFDSPEAAQLQRLLMALLEPGREGLVRAALATDILGFDGQQIFLLGQDEARLERQFEDFQVWHQLWRERGFVRMFRHLMSERAVAERLLARPDGERRLTNLLHLGELLHQQEREAKPGMEGLLQWLIRHRQADAPEDETHQLRLESDQDLVQIVTIHKSKGLQYPVVFVPFAWDAGNRRLSATEPYRFHDPRADWQPVLELGSPRWEADRVQAGREALAEGLRLLYVALTRAQQRCYLCWGNVSKAGESALAWLLHPPEDSGVADPLPAMNRGFSSLDDQALLQRLRRLQSDAGGAVQVETVVAGQAPFRELAPVDVDGGGLRPRRFLRRLQQQRRVTSFSALTRGHGNADLPDHDALGPVAREPAAPPESGDIFQFPRGARAGTALHSIFERLDFSGHTPEQLAALTRQLLPEHGISAAWSGVVCRMVRAVLDSPLDTAGRIRLAGIPEPHKLVEMGFHYPLQGLDAPALSHLLLDHGFSEEPLLRQAIERLTFPRVRGYMKGFIDLVFQAEGRFHLLDYKSNWLGGDLEAYGQPQLVAVMARDDYWLQYLFYTLALHRYLGARLRDYDYDRHFGGVFYLFLRGMRPDRSPATGVYRARPQRDLILALDRFFGGPRGGDR